ncbi:MAG: hypothetical protein JKY65_29255, partial [Planctomycetes bacterium]|nr:hypothetical protein [Planctomycetota bacterium]
AGELPPSQASDYMALAWSDAQRKRLVSAVQRWAQVFSRDPATKGELSQGLLLRAAGVAVLASFGEEGQSAATLRRQALLWLSEFVHRCRSGIEQVDDQIPGSAQVDQRRLEARRALYRNLLARARTDPDLSSLRETAAFRRLFRSR